MKKIIIFCSIIVLLSSITLIFFTSKNDKKIDNKNTKETLKVDTKDDALNTVEDEKEFEEINNDIEEKETVKEENKRSDNVTTNSKNKTTKTNTTTEANNSNDVSKEETKTEQPKQEIQTATQPVTKEEVKEEKHNNYIGVPDPNSFDYSTHHGVIEYKTMDQCLNASYDILFKDVVDIKNAWCVDVVDGNGTVLGEYLYINCDSGNCNKYK